MGARVHVDPLGEDGDGTVRGYVNGGGGDRRVAESITTTSTA